MIAENERLTSQYNYFSEQKILHPLRFISRSPDPPPIQFMETVSHQHRATKVYQLNKCEPSLSDDDKPKPKLKEIPNQKIVKVVG